MNVIKMTPVQIVDAGLNAVRKELGAAGMIRFIQHFHAGHGNYTAERAELLGDATIADVIKEIHASRKRKRKTG